MAVVTSNITFDYELEPFDFKKSDETEVTDLPPIWKALAKDIFDETDEKRAELVLALRKAAAEEDFVLPDSDAFYVKILRAGGMTVAGAIKVLENYYGHQKDCPKYFQSATTAILERTFSQLLHTVLEHRDRFGRRVYIYRPGLWDPDSVSFVEVFSASYLIAEVVSLEAKTQVAGVTCISDAGGFGWKQFKSFTLEDARTMARFVQESFPLWFRVTHVVNAPRFFRMAFAMIKPLLNERIRNSIIFHDDVTSLHNEISPHILPQELGGSQGKFTNKHVVAALNSMDDYLQSLSRYGYKEVVQRRTNAK